MSDKSVDARDSQGFVNKPEDPVRQQLDSRRSIKENINLHFSSLSDASDNSLRNKLQELLRALEQAGYAERLQQAYQETLKAGKTLFVEPPATATLDNEEVQRLLKFLVEDTNISEDFRKRLDEFRDNLNKSRPQSVRPYLVIVLHPNITSNNELLVKAWLIPDESQSNQLDKFCPLDLNNEQKEEICTIDEIPNIIHQFLGKSREHLLAQTYYPITLEIFLPLEYFFVDVEQWLITKRRKQQPIRYQHPLIIRSYERLEHEYLLDCWNDWVNNWNRVIASWREIPDISSFYYISNPKEDDWDQLIDEFQDDSQKLGFVFVGIEESQRENFCDFLSDAAIPIALWTDQCDIPVSEQVHAIQELLTSGPLSDLPNRIYSSYRKASLNAEDHTIRYLSILREDPTRLPPDTLLATLQEFPGSSPGSPRLSQAEVNPARKSQEFTSPDKSPGETKAAINTVAFTQTGEHLILGHADGSIHIQDIKGNTIQHFKAHKATIWSVKVSGNSEVIGSCSDDGTIKLWNIEDQPLCTTLISNETSVYSIDFSPDGQLLVSGGSDEDICIWKLKDQSLLRRVKGHNGIINSIDFSPDGSRIISGSDDKTIRIWDRDGNPIGVPLMGHSSWVNSVAYSPNGEIIVSGSDDKTIRIWDRDGNPVGQPFIGHTASVSSVAFSPDGQTIVSASRDRTVRLWNLEGNPLGNPCEGHTDIVKAVAFSPNGEIFISGSYDRTIRLWDLATLQEASQTFESAFTAIYSLLISANTESVSVGEDLQVSIHLSSVDSLNAVNENASSLEIPFNEVPGNDLNILLSASGFKLEGGNAASLLLDAYTNPSSNSTIPQIASFSLTALRPGDLKISAEIFRGEFFETTLETTVQVLNLEQNILPNAGTQTSSRPVPQPDLILKIQTAWNEASATCTFNYYLQGFRAASHLISGITYQSQPISVEWLEHINILLQNALETVADSLQSDGWSHLISIGQYLYQSLLPPELQTDLRTQSYRVLALSILADQDAQLPWALLHNGQKFLSEQFVIGHWYWDLSNAQPYEFPVGAINIAHYANIERPEIWGSLLKPPGAPPPLLLASGVLDELSSVEAMRGLHLIRLGQSAADVDRQNTPVPVDLAAENQNIAHQVRPVKLNFQRNHPLVTLGYIRDNYSELTNLQHTWASTFLRAGCSAFVGTLWAVNPETETAFISSFYHALWTGDSLGAAFQTARQLARSIVPDSMDWLAYSLFGDPMARPYRPVKGQGYAVVEPVGRKIDDPVIPGATIRFRVVLRRTPPVWHDDRVVEVAENLIFDNLQAHIRTFALEVLPEASIELKLTPSGNYLGWFSLLVPSDIEPESDVVQVFFVDGMQPIHTLTLPLTVQQAGGN